MQLPAEGRQGRAPRWPLEGRMRVGETAAWRELWHTPQAVAWERLGYTRVVARYCRFVVEAEQNPSNANAAAEARQLEDRLGLTPKAMRLLLWTVVGDAVGARRQERQGPGASGVDAARKRIAAVE